MAISSFASRLVPGFLVAQRYRLTRQLGEGAMGAVWAALDEVTTREVALKLLLRPDPEHKARLLREARACGALKHKNIIDVFDIMETETGEPFLIMQLLSGETVAEVLARKRRLEPEEAAAIGRDVARACSAAHAIQIIHRDLKPANIFLHHEPDIDGYIVKVLDFGIAKNLGVSDGLHTVAGGAVGSPFYMSPEQVRGDPTIDPRADIWALGVVLFEMITGVRPFQGETPEVFAKVLTGEIPSVTRYVRRVDDRLAQIVSRCLAREREHRYASAAEVAAVLEPFARAQSATLTPPPLPYAPTVPSPQAIPMPKASTPGLAPPMGVAPPPRPSQGGVILGGDDDLDEDDAPTAFYKPDEVGRASAPALQQPPAAGRWAPPPAASPMATPVPGLGGFAGTSPAAPPADHDWGRGGTVKMSPEDAARYRLPQGSAPSLTGPPPAPPPPPGLAPQGPATFQPQPGFPPVADAYATPPGYIPPPGAAGRGPGDDGYPPPPPPTAMMPGAAPSSSVTPLMASGAGPLIPDDENPFAARKLPRSVVALLAGLVVALGIITVSLIVVLSGPDEQPGATTPEGASAAPAVPPPGTTAAPAPTPAPTPAPSTTTTTTTTTTTATATVPPKPTATPTPTPAPTPRPTATSTARPKRDCSKLKLLERQRCERGG